MNRSVVLLAGLFLSVARSVSRTDDAVDRYVIAEMAALHIPGVSLCVARDDRIVKTRSYGLANVEMKVPAGAKSEFAIASMTKSITAPSSSIAGSSTSFVLEETLSTLSLFN